jgi:hypothetical protein
MYTKYFSLLQIEIIKKQTLTLIAVEILFFFP